MAAFYGQPRESMVRLMKDTGYGEEPVLSLSAAQFLVHIRKTGAFFAAKDMGEEDYYELGDGWYVIKWSTADMDAIGEFCYRAFPDVDGGIEVIAFFDVEPAPFYIDSTLPTCVVSGNLLDIAGASLATADIVFRPRGVPMYAGASLIGASLYRTRPDAFGNFSVQLLRNIDVLFEIDLSGIRYVIHVPDAPTANIMSLLPPPPPPQF